MFANYTVVPYVYKGQAQKSNDKALWLLLIKRQYELVNRWLDLQEQCFEQSTETDEFMKWITDKFETWYHLNINDVHHEVTNKV